jgi:hypothetical protein
MPLPKQQRLRKYKACGQFAVYCGKWGEEWVWRCKYCGLVIPLTDDEMDSFGLRKD